MPLTGLAPIVTQLQAIEILVHQMWRAELADGGTSIDDLVVAHRHLHDAVLVLANLTPHGLAVPGTGTSPGGGDMV